MRTAPQKKRTEMRTSNGHRQARAGAVAILCLALAPWLSTAAAAQEGSGDSGVTPPPPEVEAEAPGGGGTGSFSRPLPRTGGSADPALSDFEAALAVYESEMTDYRETITQVVRAEYDRRRGEIRTFYQSEIDSVTALERERRNEAIGDFETFLERYPRNSEHTADVLFRLSELYYEKAEDDYFIADREYQRQIDLYDMGLRPEAPEEPERDYGRTISLFRRLIRDFPEYRQIDGAWYLLGVCEFQNGNEDEAMEAWTTVARDYPDSQFAQEAWLRIGEYFFEVTEFEQAKAAYERAEQYGESRWYDKILFKLGWSDYLLGNYDLAINGFRRLLDWYETKGDETTRTLEEEALQYFAISLAEEDWNLQDDFDVDPDFGMVRINRYLPDADAPYSLKIKDRLAEMFMENQQYDAAIELYRNILATYPEDPLNPQRHEKIVLAYSRLRQPEQAFQEQELLSQLYGPGSAWYAAQEREGNTEAMQYAEQLARDNLLNTAATYYNAGERLATEAATTGNAGLEQQAIDSFLFAARLYQQFLDSYPNDTEAYTTRLYLAQSYLYSLNFEHAAEQYILVRDSEMSDEYRELAAYQVINCWEKLLTSQIDAGLLEVRALPTYVGPRLEEARAQAQAEAEAEATEEEEGGDEPRGAPTMEPIPALSTNWVASIDEYIRLGLNREDDPTTQGRFAYNAGKLFYSYRHLDEARQRFIAVMDNYCGAEVTSLAGILIIESYRMAGDFPNVEFWANEMTRRGECVTIPEELRVDLMAAIERYQMGAVAENAEALFEAGRFEEAAQEYVRLANQYAGQEFAPLGLFNAGLIYEQQLRKYDLAMQQFERLIEEYPDDPNIDGALVRIAVNARRFFDFERAISTFQILEERGYSDEEGVEFPVLDAALLLENSQRYEEAAEAYLSFVAEHPDNDRAPAVLYKVGLLYAEMDNPREMLRIFERFRREYGRWENTALINIDSAVLDTLRRTSEYYEAEGDSRNQARYDQMILDEFAARAPDDVSSRFAAARVIYNRIMSDFEDWDDIELGESLRQQQAGLAQRRDGIQPLVDAFANVDQYGSAEWTVCGYYMSGRIYQVMADLLYSLPVPDFGDDIDAEDEYVLMVEDFATQFEDAAIQAWEVAYPIMQQLGVVNQCTIDMTRQLNRYRGADYPLYKEEIRFQEMDLFSPQTYAAPPPPEEIVETTLVPRGGSDDAEEGPEEAPEEAPVDDPFEGDGGTP